MASLIWTCWIFVLFLVFRKFHTMYLDLIKPSNSSHNPHAFPNHLIMCLSIVSSSPPTHTHILVSHQVKFVPPVYSGVCGHPLEHGQPIYTRGYIFKRKPSFPFLKLSITNNYLSRGGIWVRAFIITLGFFSFLDEQSQEKKMLSGLLIV